MKLHLLRYFAVLAEELHFGRAAARLAMTQPPLSAAIKALEAEVGARLLERDSKHVRLTPAGTAFLAEARHILERVQRAGETVRAVAGGLRGRLDVGMTGSMIYRELPAIVDAFARRMPDIELTLCEMSSTEQIEALRHGQLHAGFVNVATVPEPLSALPLAPDTLVCCLPQRHALAGARVIDLAALAQERFVMFSREVAPANHDNVISTFSRAGIHPRICHAARQWLTVVALVAQGAGVALVPSTLARAGIAGVRFVPLREPAPHAVGVLAWDGAPRQPALAAFIETATELLRRPAGRGTARASRTSGARAKLKPRPPGRRRP